LGVSNVIEYNGRYCRFELDEEIYNNWDKYYSIRFYDKHNICIFEESFGRWAEFCGLGKIKECNSGPYCYFSIEKIPSIFSKLKRLFN